MAGSKPNALQVDNSPAYIIFDTDVPALSSGDNVLTRSLPKVTQSLLKTAINDIKGVMFSKCRTRVWYRPEGYNGNPNDRLHVEFTALYSTGVGKVATELVSLARQRSGDESQTDVG